MFWHANLSKIASTLDLVTHYESAKFIAPDLMKEALVAVFLTRCWLADRELKAKPNVPFSGKDLQLALFVHKLMRIVRFNTHQIVAQVPLDNRHGVNKDSQATLTVIGFAVNPNLAMANHSCDSNFGRVWQGKS